MARTAAEGRSHNYRLQLAGADVARLPFTTGAFDATFCVAVLQHVNDVPMAVRELARVTRTGGRVLAVEPDNAARYWYSSSPAGAQAFAEAQRFFGAVRAARGDSTEPAVGPRVSAIFATCGIEPVSVQLFPVSVTHIGKPPATLWQARRAGRRRARWPTSPTPPSSRTARRTWRRWRSTKRTPSAAGANFVEIQNTMLFATVGLRTDVPVEDA